MSLDITHCANKKCRKASVCRRSTIHFVKFPPSTKWLSYCAFKPDPKTGECAGFWPLDTIDLDIQYDEKEENR